MYPGPGYHEKVVGFIVCTAQQFGAKLMCLCFICSGLTHCKFSFRVFTIFYSALLYAL